MIHGYVGFAHLTNSEENTMTTPTTMALTELAKLAAMMDSAEQDVLAFTGFPRAHRAQIHITTMIPQLSQRPRHVSFT